MKREEGYTDYERRGEGRRGEGGNGDACSVGVAAPPS